MFGSWEIEAGQEERRKCSEPFLIVSLSLLCKSIGFTVISYICCLKIISLIIELVVL
ncbi:hypothetical protein RchiOBHm_Chr1g0355591 [Rosa chinensis]|uniref:Uncharacterized protein n=1 Tax=Rosa chinensis TaxID=74649 RepID=A0A2P6SHD7_ROSCH|nr:hypothetical protein RchiOBHm_Chr1g0355591 [Rosa chinensis]